MYDLGVVGGMGPEATAEIFKRIIDLTDATCDQEHIKICILNNPKIPDRTHYIINNGPSPLPIILKMIDDLKTMGVKYFIIPCNTSHLFSNYFKKTKEVVFINMINATKNYISKQHKGECICILGTMGTSKEKIYGENFEGGKIIYPDKELQIKLMNIIMSVKSKKNSHYQNEKDLFNVMEDIKLSIGKCTFVLACTELSIIGKRLDNKKIIDAMDILAISAINKCGYKIKEDKTNINISVYK